MKVNKYLYLLGVVLVLSQCREKQVGAEDTFISSNIVISVAEQYVVGEKSVYLYGQTTTSYSCNRSIVTEKITGENQFSIQYQQISPLTYCNGQSGPAFSSVRLGTLPNGDYKLELNGPGWENKGVLRIDSTNITLIFDKLKGVEIPTPTIKREQ